MIGLEVHLQSLCVTCFNCHEAPKENSVIQRIHSFCNAVGHVQELGSASTSLRAEALGLWCSISQEGM